jgi:hypothetical protein
MPSLVRLVLTVVLVAACREPAAPAPADAGGASPPSTPPAADPDPPAADPAPRGCTVDADCGDGVCEGEGCDAGAGTCAPRERMCTRDLQTYCGCDGRTFQASGSCPGARFRHRGACEGDPPGPI